MNYMKEILSQLKIRPIMFLRNNNVDNLYAYMNGYMYQIFQEDDIIPEFYPGFQKYIEDVYTVKTGQHWTKILNFYSDNEEEAMKKFFFHLDEFTKVEESNSKNYDEEVVVPDTGSGDVTKPGEGTEGDSDAVL